MFDEGNGRPNGPEPRRAVVTIFASGLTAASFSIMLEKVDVERANVHKRVNLGACQTIMPCSRTAASWKYRNCRKQPADTVFLDLGGEAEIERPRDAS